MPDISCANKNPAVLIAAGGTGGHVFPALAVAERLRELGTEVIWLGTQNGIESRVVPENEFPIHYVNVVGIRGKNILAILKAPFLLFFAIFSVINLIVKRRVRVVLGMGGFASAAAGIAAILLRKPLLLQEQNAVPGTTNKYLAPWAAKVFTGFEQAFSTRKNAVYSGNPLRSMLNVYPSPDERGVASNDELHILVVGGSLGASAINSILPGAIKRLNGALDNNSINKSLRITHQAGVNEYKSVADHYKKLGVTANVTPFIENIAEAYANADLVVARSGALTVSEVAAIGVASILIPYPHATDDHQSVNAAWLASCGAAVVIQQSDLSEQKLAEVITNLLRNESELLEMASQARSHALVDGANIVAGACQEYVCG